MRKILLCLAVAISAMLSAACTDDEPHDYTEVVEIIVHHNSIPVYIVGEGIWTDGIGVKIDSRQESWDSLPFGAIEGFDYEEGYDYLLRIEVLHHYDAELDDDSPTYKLIKILSKTISEE